MLRRLPVGAGRGARPISPLLLPAALAVATLFGVGACASFHVTDVPAHEADLYPSARERSGVVVAVDAIGDSRRALRRFGADLPARGVLPVEILVSNHGPRPVRVSSADVVVMRGRRVVDPIPIPEVVELARNRDGWLSGETADRIEHFFARRSFHTYTIAPGETYRGALFLEDEPVVAYPMASRYLDLSNALPHTRLKLSLAAVDPETGERTLFGPLPIHR